MLTPSQIAELTRTLSGDQITLDPTELNTYGKDWSGVLEPKPCAVVFPRTTEEVSKVLMWAGREKVAVVPSGGRTGLSGGAMAARGELVLSLAKMNQIGEVDVRGQTVWVQAGAVTQAVHEQTKSCGLTWPVDFASKGSSQVGGNISTNAGGINVIRYGLTRNWVAGLKVVTMDGRIWDFLSPLEKNNTGLDFKHLFVGTEGTLGVITEAVLKLAPLTQNSHTVLLNVTDMAAVFRVFEVTRKAPLMLRAFECLDLGCYQKSCEFLRMTPPLVAKGSAFVLVEFERAQDEVQFDGWLAQVMEIAVDGVVATNSREATDIWKIRESIAESLMHQTRVHQQDISVPVAALEKFTAEIQAEYKKAFSTLEFFLFGHIGDGNLHVLVRKPPAMPEAEFVVACDRADQGLFRFVQSYRGSVSAEHGIGLLKKKALGFSRTAQEQQLFFAIKQVFDPQGLLNPGKIISNEIGEKTCSV